MTQRQIKKTYQKALKKITRSIIEGYKPEKIILFGSMLSANQESNDIDLFIVKQTKTLRLGDRARETRHFLPDQRIPVDFLIYTPQEIKREINRGNVFIAGILREGKILYNAPLYKGAKRPQYDAKI